MKHRTNRQRAERKAEKAETRNDRQLRINFHTRMGFHEIVAAVKKKTSHIVTRQAHPGRGIEKEVWYPQVVRGA